MVEAIVDEMVKKVVGKMLIAVEEVMLKTVPTTLMNISQTLED